MKAELKTKPNDQSVEAFLDQLTDSAKREDAYRIVELMQKATGAKPKMWGSGIIGFGDNHLVYESGRELDWFIVGFSPRKENLTLYLTPGFSEKQNLLKSLGKFKTGKGCLYIKRLADINIDVMENLIRQSARSAKNCS